MSTLLPLNLLSHVPYPNSPHNIYLQTPSPPPPQRLDAHFLPPSPPVSPPPPPSAGRALTDRATCPLGQNTLSFTVSLPLPRPPHPPATRADLTCSGIGIRSSSVLLSLFSLLLHFCSSFFAAISSPRCKKNEGGGDVHMFLQFMTSINHRYIFSVPIAKKKTTKKTRNVHSF